MSTPSSGWNPPPQRQAPPGWVSAWLGRQARWKIVVAVAVMVVVVAAVVTPIVVINVTRSEPDHALRGCRLLHASQDFQDRYDRSEDEVDLDSATYLIGGAGDEFDKAPDESYPKKLIDRAFGGEADRDTYVRLGEWCLRHYDEFAPGDFPS